MTFRDIDSKFIGTGTGVIVLGMMRAEVIRACDYEYRALRLALFVNQLSAVRRGLGVTTSPMKRFPEFTSPTTSQSDFGVCIEPVIGRCPFPLRNPNGYDPRGLRQLSL